jgi:isopenicillin N synthase-like dioxygenase
VQYDVNATTPSGSVSVDTVSPEELKHNLEVAKAFFVEQARQQETLGNTERAADWKGLHDMLSQAYTLSLKISGLDRFGESLGDQLLIGTVKVARGALVGAAKGGIDFVQGTKQLLFNTQEVARELENSIKRLDYFVVRLSSNNPAARNEVRSAIKQFLEAPIEQKTEFLVRLVVSFKIAPELFGKGIGKVFEAAGTLAGEIGKKITKDAEAVIADAKPPFAVTPEGYQAPVQLEGAAEPTIIAKMEGDIAKVGGTKVPQQEVAPKVEPARRDIEGTKQWIPEVEEVAKHNSTFKTQTAADASRLEVEFLEDKLPHIFEDREGHLPDTPEHRSLLLEVASDPKNYFAKADIHGSTWCEKFLDDGSQVWIILRQGKIRDGGRNITPIKWNPETGLCSLTIPKK